ncbi:hypothetical protein [Natrinema altunense]|uniref:Uncharacterized protein n=1 Tax=Natrinema altunense (strain JCM 12890 / CGMCC 1.3731 / AJ2) TaxID=1227494 RepID=L9ZGZ8_NATA2|nr:hypothetical protein [Natrinema altunense]ELY85765.1 hypothetical protein C485_11208 [Natrinema altunense JCM 12890]
MNTRTDGPVQVQIEVADGPEMISTGGGAIQISVDGTRVNIYENEAEKSWEDWAPEYVGDFLALDLPALINIAQKLYSGNIDRYETIEYLLEGHRSYFVFEPLSSDTIRVAFQTREQVDRELTVPYPTPKSARGYVVDTAEFCNSLLDCAQEFQREATERGVANDEFSERIAEFESVLRDT